LGFAEVALIGGSNINTFFAKENLIDELWITIEPIIFGKGLNLFTQEIRMDLEILSIENLNKNTLLLKYKVMRNEK
jgi:dihydrofolate reductase